MATVLAGFLAIGVGWAAIATARRGYQLRRPTEDDLDAITAPIGSILVRHLPMSGISPDIIDGLKAVAAADRYVNRGPLLHSLGADLQESE